MTYSENTGGVATELYLGTVISYSGTSGVQIQLDGQDQPMQKRFKRLNTVSSGNRVLVAKMNGTYIILGRLT